MDKAVLMNMKDGPTFSVDELLVNRGVVVEDMDIRDLDLSDRTFAVHGEDAVIDILAESLQRDGQIDPIIVRKQQGRWQLIDGFRRVAAAQRNGMTRLKVRRFDALSTLEAALWVVKNITVDLPYPEALRELAERLSNTGQQDAAALVLRYSENIAVAEEEAPVEAAPAFDEPTVEQSLAEVEEEAAEVEVTPDELADQVVAGFASVSDDLQLVQENWADLQEEKRASVLEQLQYYAQLYNYLSAEGAPAEEVEEAPSEEPTE